MNEYEVTFDLSGRVTITVEAHDEDQAEALAEEKWDGYCDDLEIDRARIDCVRRAQSVDDLGETPEEQAIAEVVCTTVRQFRVLTEIGVRRALYAVPLEGEDAKTADSIIRSELSAVAIVMRDGGRTYLEAMS